MKCEIRRAGPSCLLCGHFFASDLCGILRWCHTSRTRPCFVRVCEGQPRVTKKVLDLCPGHVFIVWVGLGFISSCILLSVCSPALGARAGGSSMAGVSTQDVCGKKRHWCPQLCRCCVFSRSMAAVTRARESEPGSPVATLPCICVCATATYPYIITFSWLHW